MSMQILNFGSLNIDHVYAVERFVRAGECGEQYFVCDVEVRAPNEEPERCHE